MESSGLLFAAHLEAVGPDIEGDMEEGTMPLNVLLLCSFLPLWQPGMFF